MVCMDLMGGDLWEGYWSLLFIMGLEIFVIFLLGDGSELSCVVLVGIDLFI